MRIFRGADTPPQAADPRTFAGSASTSRLAAIDADPSVHIYRVDFDQGSRTNWHVHSGEQWLFVLAGRVRVQRWGEAPFEVEAGDTVLVARGEKHWHGAAPGSRGAHLAVNIGVTTEWLEVVGDAEYRR